MPPSPTPPANDILVRKYGGSSLATVERIRDVARDICAQRAAGYQMVIVVSAMGQTTNELAELARQVNPAPPRRELDMLLSVGERITMSLLSMALAAEGCSAISYTGSQCAIITDTSHTNARIKEVKGDRVRQSLAAGHVVVVAGFQGVSETKEITTLGRGGSDTTAVALAAALGASRCEILKDVDGVMTADPARLPAARRHETLSYRELEDMAVSGCGVVHHRAVRYAAKHGVPLFVGSSFNPGPGTHIDPGPDGISPITIPDHTVTAPTATTTRFAPAFRPLAMIVTDPVAWLELVGENGELLPRWVETLTSQVKLAECLSEWWSETPDCRWGVLGDSAYLTTLHADAEAFATDSDWRIRFRPELGCITLVGGRQGSWLFARQTLAALLLQQGIEPWWLQVDGPALRLLIPAGSLSRLLDPLHAAFWPA
ncbi:MAG: aspartate kinase [bacterium]